MAGVPAELIERLYAAPPDGFVAARDQAAAEAKVAGDPARAREIARLRKPTVAAWLVNLLVIRRPELVDGLVELAAALRTAQRELRGPQLRELSAQRREVVSALVAQARTLAREVDPTVAAGKLPLAEVEATFNAAFSDADVAERVRSGRLVRAATYAGFGEVPRPQLRLVTAQETAAGRRTEPKKGGRPQAATDRAAAERSRRAEEAARAAQRRALTRELANARTQEKRAESELERAAAAERDGGRVLAEIESTLAELERRRAAAAEELSRCKLARKGAERAAAAARRRAGEVQAAVEAFDAEGEPR